MLPHSSAGPQGSSLRLGDWHPRSTYGITIAWPDCYTLLTRETQTNSPRLSLRWEVYNDRYSARYQAPNGTYVDTEDIFTIEDVRAWLAPMEAPGISGQPLVHRTFRRVLKNLNSCCNSASNKTPRSEPQPMASRPLVLTSILRIFGTSEVAHHLARRFRCRALTGMDGFDRPSPSKRSATQLIVNSPAPSEPPRRRAYTCPLASSNRFGLSAERQEPHFVWYVLGVVMR